MHTSPLLVCVVSVKVYYNQTVLHPIYLCRLLLGQNYWL